MLSGRNINEIAVLMNSFIVSTCSVQCLTLSSISQKRAYEIFTCGSYYICKFVVFEINLQWYPIITIYWLKLQWEEKNYNIMLFIPQVLHFNTSMFVYYTIEISILLKYSTPTVKYYVYFSTRTVTTVLLQLNTQM